MGIIGIIKAWVSQELSAQKGATNLCQKPRARHVGAKV